MYSRIFTWFIFQTIYVIPKPQNFGIQFLTYCKCTGRNIILNALRCPLKVPMIVKALHKQLKEKSVKTRQCCFNMLTELVNVLPGALTQHIPVLIPGMAPPCWRLPAPLSFHRPGVLFLCLLRCHLLAK